MTAIDYRLAAPRPIEIEFKDSDGVVIQDGVFQIRFVSAGYCLSVDGVFSDGLYLFDIIDSKVAANRKYNVNIYYEDSDGWFWLSEFDLLVIGGC